ncbi:RYamide receptor-like [Mytilus trossulus]|uniref:RYamide receptor-like n=1 Tax=Mytilus trossulus TaxID=6551 RepID=UPI003006846B
MMDYEYSTENYSQYNLTAGNATFGIEFYPPAMNMVVLVLFLFLYSTVVLIGIGGNAFVCFTTFTLKKQTVTNFFMTNLAASDILMATICIPFTVLSNLVFHYWPFGAILCPAVGFLQVTSVLQRAFTLVFITYDQHKIVWHPLGKRLDKKEARFVMIILWILAALAAIPVAMFARVVNLETGNGQIGICMEDWQNQEEKKIYSAVVMILQYFLPLAIMVVCYTHMGVIIWLRKTPGEQDIKRDRLQIKSKKKTVRVLAAVVAAYALAWLPIHTLTLVGDSYPEIYDMPHADVVWMTCHWLAFSSTGITPFIYFRSNSAFRVSLKRLFSCFKRTRKTKRESVYTQASVIEFSVKD